MPVFMSVDFWVLLFVVLLFWLSGEEDGGKEWMDCVWTSTPGTSVRELRGPGW